MTTSPLDDQRIEVMIGNLLRAGVLLAAAVVVVGGIIYLVRHGLQPADFGVFRGEAAALRTLASHPARCSAPPREECDPTRIAAADCHSCRARPFSAVAFTIERDYLYVVLTLIVLAVLLYSLLASGAA